MSNLCADPTCYAFGRYCRIPGHVKKEDKPAARPVGIKPESDSEKERQKEYKKLRKPFLTKNYRCQVKGCNNASTEVHHMKGKIGDLLTDMKFWLAVCNEHHRKITDDSGWAYDNGYSLSRLAEETK